MIDTITVRSHSRKKSAAVLAYEALRRERVEQLKRENEARERAGRKTLIARAVALLWRRG